MSGLPTIDTAAVASGSGRAAWVATAPTGYVATAATSATTSGIGFDIKRHGWMNRPRGPGGVS